MDRRLLAFGVVLLAACALIVSVVVVGFVGVEGVGEEYEVVWEADVASEYLADDHEIAVATVDGDPVLGIPSTDGETCGVAALDADGETRWSDHYAADACAPHVADAVATASLGGEPIFVVADAAGRLRAYDAASGELRFEYDLGAEGVGQPAVADVTGDGTDEIVVTGFDGTVHVVDAEAAADAAEGAEAAADAAEDAAKEDGDAEAAADAKGAAVWTREFEGSVSNRPIVGDVTGDGTVDVAVATRDGGDGSVRVLDADGDEQWRADAGPGVTTWRLATVEEGAGGGPVLVAGVGTGDVVAYEGVSGDVRWSARLQEGSVRVGETSPGRILAAGTGSVWSLDLEDGGVVWRQQIGERGRIAPPAVGDVTGDENADVAVAGSEGVVAVLAATRGSVEHVEGVEGRYQSGPTLVDVTDDGREELVLLRHDGTVVAVSVQD